MPKYTTKPWYLWQRNAGAGWITDTPEPASDTVPYGTNIIAKIQNVGHWPTNDANGRLITAAPVVFEALKALVAAHDEDPPMLTDIEWENARVAIAEAE